MARWPGAPSPLHIPLPWRQSRRRRPISLSSPASGCPLLLPSSPLHNAALRLRLLHLLPLHLSLRAPFVASYPVPPLPPSSRASSFRRSRFHPASCRHPPTASTAASPPCLPSSVVIRIRLRHCRCVRPPQVPSFVAPHAEPPSSPVPRSGGRAAEAWGADQSFS